MEVDPLRDASASKQLVAADESGEPKPENEVRLPRSEQRALVTVEFVLTSESRSEVKLYSGTSSRVRL